MITAVDELPETCKDCPFLNVLEYFDWCDVQEKVIRELYVYQGKDPDCPLKKLNIDGFWGTVYIGEQCKE